MNKNHEVVMIGLGYIGLPTAELIAQKKTYVHGVDINPKVVETINRGEIHIIEPELKVLNLKSTLFAIIAKMAFIDVN